LIKLGKAVIELHRHSETYGCLSMKNVLIDQQKNVYLNSFITKDIPPYVHAEITNIDRPLRIRHMPILDAGLPDVHIGIDIVRSHAQKI
jgi:hypothetical protein